MQGKPTIISREDLAKKVRDQDDFTLLEILPEASFREAHLPGAINLPGGEVRDRIGEIAPDKDQTLVVYCASPSCSASDRAARVLVEMGYTDVRDYRGGKEHWREGGFEVESGEGVMVAA